MNFECNNHALDQLLMQTLEAGEFGDVLKKCGIVDENIKVHLQHNKGIIASCQVSQNRNQVHSHMSLAELGEEIISIINQGEDKFELLSNFSNVTDDPPETPFQFILDIGETQFEQSVAIAPRVRMTFSSVRCCPCPNPRRRCCAKR